jgi:hypothetical protein
MKKMLFLFAVLCLPLSACVPAALRPQAATSPAPISEADIQATVAIAVEQTLQSLPSPTLVPPSNTPVMMTATSVPTQVTTTPTETQNPLLLTLTATLGTGTVIAGAAGTATLNSNTPTPALGITTPTGTNHYQYYGTMPPDLPSGKIWLKNMSKVDTYISLQCTTKDGYVTVIEYPVGGSTVNTNAPAGRYVYVAWIGGKKFTGNFKLDKFQDLTILMYKDRIQIK